MRISALIIALLLILASAPTYAQTPGLVESSLQTIEHLKRIEQKLISDQKQLDSGFNDMIAGARTAVENAADFRRQMALQSALLKMAGAWGDDRFHRPVLYAMAEVDMAIEDLSDAEMADVLALEQSRRRAMRQLIGLVATLRNNQENLVAYLQDQSTGKRFDELNIDLMTASIVEAKELRNALDDSVDNEVDFDTERRRLQEAVDRLRRLLEMSER